MVGNSCSYVVICWWPPQLSLSFKLYEGVVCTLVAIILGIRCIVALSLTKNKANIL